MLPTESNCSSFHSSKGILPVSQMHFHVRTYEYMVPGRITAHSCGKDLLVQKGLHQRLKSSTSISFACGWKK